MPRNPRRISPDHGQRPARRAERPEYDPMLDIKDICNIEMGDTVIPMIPGLSVRMIPPPHFLNEGREECPCYAVCPRLQEAIGFAVERVLSSNTGIVEITLPCPLQQRSKGTCEVNVSLSATN